MSMITSSFGQAIIQGWQDYHKQLIVIVRSLTPQQLAIRVGPDLRSVHEILAHTVAGRAFWFSGVLKEGDEEVAAMRDWDDPGQPEYTTADYIHGLQATWNMMSEAMARWTDEQLAEQIVLPWIGPAYPITRSFVIWHVIEHDLHHGGEISHSLGMHGLAIELPPGPPRD